MFSTLITWFSQRNSIFYHSLKIFHSYTMWWEKSCSSNHKYVLPYSIISSSVYFMVHNWKIVCQQFYCWHKKEFMFFTLNWLNIRLWTLGKYFSITKKYWKLFDIISITSHRILSNLVASINNETFSTPLEQYRTVFIFYTWFTLFHFFHVLLFVPLFVNLEN